MSTVRDEAFNVMRRLGMTRMFGNPGSTEIPFLTGFPDDLEFVLGLHEGAVVGMASGYALGTGRPSLVNLHTAAGLGNAVNAIVCARDNRVPAGDHALGQQHRAALISLGPFLTGRNLERLAGDYPVWSTQPAHATEVRRCDRAETLFSRATVRRGTLVDVPVISQAVNGRREPHDRRADAAVGERERELGVRQPRRCRRVGLTPVQLGRNPARCEPERPRGDHERPLGAGQRLAERLDRQAVGLRAAYEVARKREVVPEREVEHAVRRGGGAAKDVEIVERSPALALLGPGCREGLRGGIRPGEPDDLMTRAEQLGDDGGADEARRAGDENVHGASRSQ